MAERTPPAAGRFGRDRLPPPVWLGGGSGGSAGGSEDVEGVAPPSAPTVVSALVACVTLGGLVFVADMVMTLADGRGTVGVAIPILYLGVLVPCLWLPWRNALPMVAGVTSGLTGVAFAMATGPVSAAGIVDRLLFALVIWAGALALSRIRVLRVALVQARTEARRASLGKSRFLSAAGHDLRHPVQAGLLFQDVLSRRLRGTPHTELVANLGQSLMAMQGMLNGLLQLSRLDSGRIAAHPVGLPVRTVLESLAGRFGPIASASGLALRVVGSGAVIRSDLELLLRLCDALLSNAVKYTRSGRVLVGCRRRGEWLSIQVWDTGIGIPREHIREIFEEFRQLRQTDSESGQGLGLSLAERLGRVLDHPIGVRSLAGRGSVFEVLVPLAGTTGVSVPLARHTNRP